MVEFPSVLGERRKRHHQPGNGMARARHPAIMIDAAIAKHLEILSRVCLLGFRIIEGINHRCPIKGPLRRPVDALGEWQTRGFQHSRRNISDVSKLGANFSLGFYARGPMDHDSVSSAAVMRSDLF